MKSPTDSDGAAGVAEIVAGLSEAQRRAVLSDWDAFCSCDWHDMSCDAEGFPERLEAAGFVIFDDVNDDDLNHSFAGDLGIVAGGSVWRLTPLGLSVRQYLEQKS